MQHALQFDDLTRYLTLELLLKSSRYYSVLTDWRSINLNDGLQTTRILKMKRAYCKILVKTSQDTPL